ncbi:hypothetical protein CONCODRAFT_5487 [Conidiobolus coronatus NRRL 28638]|uniref:Uncharacterized protein n=1 Tax=Conidiobolus coronatus (strain ATCC 28846 / CBS 209.66 / NRRL 28638) TaxID=796925 RepID=A0A137P9U3_CONC2|nr:hypothetical protein CONCODRAFT_5487 [Conidiobolus coronatus NRRL 28638]|eukprot:KXN71777.1 hypothetical protein CONCODRAFT_5487 [Conidiobolus coronatus NRRL 28638]
MNLIILLSNVVLITTITLNLSDKDKLVRVNIDDIVKIGLNSADSAEKTSWEWIVPTTSNAEVLEAQVVDKLSDPGIDAIFKVIGKGSATLTVSNGVGGPKYAWSAFASSNPEAVVNSSSTIVSNGNAKSVFKAVRDGSALLSSLRSFTPVANQACPNILLVFADIELTNADNMKTINANLGEKININLTASNSVGGSQYQWSAPVSSNNILGKKSSATLQNGDASGTFTANEAGTAELSSGKSCKPMPNQICSHAILSWKVTIDVK